MNKEPFYRVIICNKSKLDNAIHNALGSFYELLEISPPSINFFGTVAVTIKYQFRKDSTK